MRHACLTLALAFAGGCIVSMGTTKTVTPPEAHVPVPDKFQGSQAPALVDSGVDGCKQAPSLDPNLYYCAKDEHWFRYALNRWYLAFTWDGNWFPVGGSELPRALAALTPAPEEVVKSREDRLKELDKKLEDLDQQQPPKSGH
ncbi:MAG: hypothetical protein ACHQ6T_03610 [Myxococcota bacterium]